MSSDPSGSAGEPQTQQVDPAAPSSASSENLSQDQADSADARNKPRIKIGTQRPGAPLPRVEPRHKLVMPGTAEPEPAAGAPHAPAALQPQPMVAAPEDLSRQSTIPSQAPTTAPAMSPAPHQTPAAESRQWPQEPEPAPNLPQPELKPRPHVSAPTRPRKEIIDLTPTGKVAPPNIRAELSPELTRELEESLGGSSLDDLIAGETQQTPALENLEPETKLKARVVRVHRDNVFLDLGGRNQGVAPLHQFAVPPETGSVVEVTIAKFNAEDGLYELTVPGGAVSVGEWADVSEGMVVDARVTGHNKGGLECEINNLRGFIPASQVSLFRVENLEELVGQKFPCVVTEVNIERRNLVLSRRAMLEREQAESKQKLLAELAVGDVREGIVRNIRDFGAFVDLGGVDGMLHVSQLSWDRIKHPSEVLQLNQKIKVRIQKIDPETGKISLAYRDLGGENPWKTVDSRYTVGSRVSGKVSKIMDFGAFVKLEPGVEGLVHISELAHQRVFRVSDIVSEGQDIEAKVVSVDAENQRISLSVKAIMARPELPKKATPEPEEPATPPPPRKEPKIPLKGGLGRSTGGSTGLKW